MEQGEQNKIKRELRIISTQICHLTKRAKTLEGQLQDPVQSKPDIT